MNWRLFFPLIFLFSCVDGFISNFLYPAILPLLYRDILVLLVYLLFIFQEPVNLHFNDFFNSTNQSCWILALCFVFVGFLQIFNPALPSLIVGLLGFKTYFFYWPLAVLAYAYMKDIETAQRFLGKIAILSIPINLFGIYQFFAGPYFMVDTFGPGFERAVIMAGFEGAIDWDDSFVRVIGTFSSSGQYAHFLVINIMICFALFLGSHGLRKKSFLGLALFLSFVALLTTGTRGGLLLVGTSVLLSSYLCGVGRGFWMVFILSGGLYFGFHWLGESVMKRFETLRDMDMISERTIETTPLMFQAVLESNPMGRGIGIATGASRHLVGEMSIDIEMVENHPTKLLLEVGILGAASFYAFAFSLIIHWVHKWILLPKETRTLTGPLSSYCLVALALSFLIGGFDSPPGSLYFWTFLGIVAKMAVISKKL